MENEISNEYIENAVIELAGFFGIKEPINGEKIIYLVKSGKVEDGIKLIARQLGLPININITNELLYMYKEKLDKFKLFLNYLLKNHEKKFSNEDSKKIINFFQPCYLDSFNLYIEKQHRNAENCKVFIKNSMNFNEEQIKQSDKYFEDLSVLTKDLKHRLDNLESDIKILKKYIDYLYKIKIFFR